MATLTKVANKKRKAMEGERTSTIKGGGGDKINNIFWARFQLGCIPDSMKDSDDTLIFSLPFEDGLTLRDIWNAEENHKLAHKYWDLEAENAVLSSAAILLNFNNDEEECIMSLNGQLSLDFCGCIFKMDFTDRR